MKTIFHYEILEQEVPAERVTKKVISYTEKIKDLNDVKKFKKELTGLAHEIKKNGAVDTFGKKVHESLGRKITAKQNVMLQIYGKAKGEAINEKRVSIDGIRGDQTRFIENKLNELYGFTQNTIRNSENKKTENTVVVAQPEKRNSEEVKEVVANTIKGGARSLIKGVKSLGNSVIDHVATVFAAPVALVEFFQDNQEELKAITNVTAYISYIISVGWIIEGAKYTTKAIKKNIERLVYKTMQAAKDGINNTNWKKKIQELEGENIVIKTSENFVFSLDKNTNTAVKIDSINQKITAISVPEFEKISQQY